MGPFEVRGPRAGFEWTTAIPRIDASAVGVAVVRAWGKAEDALLVVSETVRVVEQFVDEEWFWMVTLRVSPTAPCSMSDDRRTVDAGGVS